MKTILSWRRHQYLKRVGIFLIAIALIVGTVSCDGDDGVRYSLTMAANPVAGGTATDLTNASPYTAGTAVSIKAVANPGYQFVGWTAPAGGFTNANAAQTSFTMPAQAVTVTANFQVEVGPLDHFKWYLAEGAESIGDVVYLEDQFGAVEATVGYAAGFGNPAEKVHGEVTTPISNPDHHLAGYEITYEEEPQEWFVEVENQFGMQQLTVYGPVGLAVPTQKEGHQPPAGLDHFLLYEVIEGSSVDVGIYLQDEFDDERQESWVYEPLYFANPVRKIHGDTVTEIVNPDAHLVFYYIDASFSGDVEVVNQFGEQTLSLYIFFDIGGLAVPSEKIAVSTPQVWDWYDLDAIRDNLGSGYVLMNDLDSTTAGYTELASPTANGGKGWQPIGSLDVYFEQVDPFTGTFDGQGYEIWDLFIDRPDENGVGLFGAVGGGGVIEDVGVMDADVTGTKFVGGLVGNNVGDVSYCYASGSVIGSEGSYDVGGLVGWNGGDMTNCYATVAVTGGAGGNWTGGLAGAVGGTYEDTYYYGSVSDCYATGTVAGDSGVGGLVGVVGGEGDTGSYVSDSYATGSVTGNDYAGGLVGVNWYATVINCYYTTGTVTGSYNGVGGLVGGAEGCTVSDSYSTGSVIGSSGSSSVGGLVGGMNDSIVSNSYAAGTVTSGAGGEGSGGLVGRMQINASVSNCYATGTVTGGTGGNFTGGLVGGQWNGCTVSDSYSTGSVSGDDHVGGLVGANGISTISDSYSTGSVSGNTWTGGLVGENGGTVSNSFWDTETSGQGSSSGGTGKTTAQMKDIATFTDAGWDIIAVDHDYDRNTGYVWNIVDDVTYAFLSWQPV
jgi:uncharacterized repeat protein (TIGR02543 family)